MPVSLHEKIKSGDASVPNGKVPAAVVKSLTNRPDDPPTPPRHRKLKNFGRSASYYFPSSYRGGCRCGQCYDGYDSDPYDSYDTYRDDGCVYQ